MNFPDYMKTIGVAKILITGVFTLAMTACSTFTPETVEPWQGKVWRAVVSEQLVDTTKVKAKNDKWAVVTNFDEKRDQGIRMARVQFASGWDMVVTTVVVPDQIEFASIPKGTMVDVMAERGPDNNYATMRFTRILRVVCAHTDDKCIDSEKAAKRFKATVDIDGEAVTKELGLTFKRRVTKEDLEKFD